MSLTTDKLLIDVGSPMPALAPLCVTPRPLSSAPHRVSPLLRAAALTPACVSLRWVVVLALNISGCVQQLLVSAVYPKLGL